jgi:hypothetical protein
MNLLKSYVDYAVEYRMDGTDGWNKLSRHGTLEEAKETLEEYKVRAVFMDKKCQFRIVMLEITEREVN